jgi:hypothetical protein
MEVSNPFVLDLIGSPFVWVLVPLVIGHVAKHVRQVIGIRGDLQEIAMAEEQNERERELHEVMMESLQLDNVKKRLEVAQLVEAVEPRMRDELGLRVRSLADSSKNRLEILKDQAVDAAAEVSLETKGGVRFEETGNEESH